MDALIGGVTVLERAISYTLGSLALATPPLLANPTPCARWNLRDLLEHFSDSLAALDEAASTGRVTLTSPAHPGGVIPQVRDQAVRLLGAWTKINGDFPVRLGEAPVDVLTAPLVAGAGAIEVTVHGWDVAQACGQSRPIPDELADELLDLSLLMVRPWDRPGRFAPPLQLPPFAAPGDRLLAFLGRSYVDT
jgi:uncharacterized protein (TIGR03086 family)